MARKPKARRATGEAQAAEARVTDPEQFARFLEEARAAGVDETGEALERAFAVVARAPPAPLKAAKSPRRRGA